MAKTTLEQHLAGWLGPKQRYWDLKSIIWAAANSTDVNESLLDRIHDAEL